jgi:esterase/lipase superfamily enzyme
MITPVPSSPTPDPGRADIKHAGWVRSLTLALFVTLAGVYGYRPVAADIPAKAVDGGNESGINVSVPYVTNRRLKARDLGRESYGGERGSPSVGWCEVVFTPIPVINQIAPYMPFYVADETRQVRFDREADTEAFWERVQQQIAHTNSGSVVVFVHGYSYDVERHCKAAAELQRNLAGNAIVLMFSWPSNGRPTDYIPDQADVEWSVPFLARLLADLGDGLGPERVQVLAHSLGSRGVLFALERLRAERETPPLIGQLVLMAPDFDAQTFVERLPELVPLAAGITLYASSNDTPLKASRQLHDAPRLGEAGEFLTVAEGMQTVDVSPLGRYQVLGHEYFLFHPRVAADLAALLGEGRSAPERTGLRPVPFNGLVYWESIGGGSQSGTGDE